MSIFEVVVMLLVGALAGGLAGQIVKGSNLGLAVNIAIGILGGLVGGWLLNDVFKASISTGSGFINSVLTSLVGAIVLLLVIGMLNGRASSPRSSSGRSRSKNNWW
ncbi:MAG: GlsB/YeaQ/YmgE family stress response membrane protein [Lewinella sp.]|nr:GlsB/YeaQ/YmgE family stress response membrane protein [Lewinella sp.]